MTLIIGKSADAQLDKIQLRLNDPKCLVSSNSTHLIASVGYNSCGTVTEETAENIVFKNTATSYDTSVVITRQNGISFPFNCSFPKKSRVSASFRAHKSDYVFTEAGFGNFTYKFQFFTDGRFVEVNSVSPLEVILKEQLYMEIQVSSSVPNVELFVESCKATPHDNPSDPLFYDIIQNGCIKDSTVRVYPGTRTQYRFAMEAFSFIGNYPEVYLSCTVILCKTGAANTRCTQGCIKKSVDSSKHRHKRSLISESQQHFISQGPVIMKRETSNDKGEEKTLAFNGNMLVIALSGMVTVALISVTLNIYMKRARAAGYQRLNTQEF
ncbi:CUB and zona pellucida-like domain-containing protein 1 [Pyxicephalus adspersus]|uniref:CUB and zona pellucida-like domain-containing protein 1 n=1 Tax=Pyxicephalus adspersus TaxID=30357 RepID=UPI003B5C025B